MRLMLDTHAFLWWLDGDQRLPARVRALIGEPANEVLVSAASVWEITIKARLGKLPRATDVATDVPACIESQGFLPLSITCTMRSGLVHWSDPTAIPSTGC